MTKLRSLSLKLSTGSSVPNTDKTHTATTLHVEPNANSGVASGQLHVLTKDELEPGVYSLSLSYQGPLPGSPEDVPTTGTGASRRATDKTE